ncbi:hypothetical protein LXL04_011765 [Taraxacum kok-saghyz]
MESSMSMHKVEKVNPDHVNYLQEMDSFFKIYREGICPQRKHICLHGRSGKENKNKRFKYIDYIEHVINFRNILIHFIPLHWQNISIFFTRIRCNPKTIIKSWPPMLTREDSGKSISSLNQLIYFGIKFVTLSPTNGISNSNSAETHKQNMPSKVSKRNVRITILTLGLPAAETLAQTNG